MKKSRAYVLLAALVVFICICTASLTEGRLPLIEQATAQAQRILDSATEDANNIRIGAVQYTDDMLGKLQYIIEHSIKDNKEKYTSLMTGLENVLTVVTNNRKELVVEDEEPQQETAEQAEAVEDDSEDVVYEENDDLLDDDI